MPGQGLDILSQVGDIIGDLATPAFGLGTAVINGQTLQNVAGINAAGGGNTGIAGAGVPQVLYYPQSAPVAPQSAANNKIFYWLGGGLILALIIGGVIVYLKKGK